MVAGDLLNAFYWTCALFLPGPKILWASLSVAVFFTDSVYLQYFALGYYYEVFVNHMLKHMESGVLCGQPVLPVVGGPCTESQLFVSFFVFISVHIVYNGRHGFPKLKSAICAVCFAALVLSLFSMGACSIKSIAFGALVGVFTGAMRGLFYRAVLIEPIHHILCSTRGSLVQCVVLYASQSKLYGTAFMSDYCDYCTRIGCHGECINEDYEQSPHQMLLTV